MHHCTEGLLVSPLCTSNSPEEHTFSLIYTTNTIESRNRRIGKDTKNRSVFPSEDSIFKLLNSFFAHPGL